jgi:hypothetical protein
MREGLAEEILLVLEIDVDGAFGYARGLGNVLQAGGAETVAGEGVESGFQLGAGTLIRLALPPGGAGGNAGTGRAARFGGGGHT